MSRSATPEGSASCLQDASWLLDANVLMKETIERAADIVQKCLDQPQRLCVVSPTVTAALTEISTNDFECLKAREAMPSVSIVRLPPGLDCREMNVSGWTALGSMTGRCWMVHLVTATGHDGCDEEDARLYINSAIKQCTGNDGCVQVKQVSSG